MSIAKETEQDRRIEALEAEISDLRKTVADLVTNGTVRTPLDDRLALTEKRGPGRPPKR